jgi:hypothetical protein
MHDEGNIKYDNFFLLNYIIIPKYMQKILYHLLSYSTCFIKQKNCPTVPSSICSSYLLEMPPNKFFTH